MLRALYIPTGEYLEASNEPEFKKLAASADKGDFICPYCKFFDNKEVRLFPRFREDYRPHFFHEHHTDCAYSRKNPDTKLHYEGCIYLRDFMLKQIKDDFLLETKNLTIAIDEPLITPSGQKRIADVYCMLPLGFPLIYEFQKSPITTAELKSRTDDYLSLNAEVAWFLYGKANTEAARQWCRENTGVAYSIKAELNETANAIED